MFHKLFLDPALGGIELQLERQLYLRCGISSAHHFAISRYRWTLNYITSNKVANLVPLSHVTLGGVREG